MATCPKCFEQKDLFARFCPHCVQETKTGDQISFEVLAGVIQIVIVIAVIVWLTS